MVCEQARGSLRKPWSDCLHTHDGMFYGQVLKGSSTIFRYIGRDQVLVQGCVDPSLQEADRQLED